MRHLFDSDWDWYDSTLPKQGNPEPDFDDEEWEDEDY